MEISRQQQVRFYPREQHSQSTLSQETRHTVLNSALSIRTMHEVIGPPGPSRRTALSLLARKVWDSSWRETVRTSMGPPAAKRLKKSWTFLDLRFRPARGKHERSKWPGRA